MQSTLQFAPSPEDLDDDMLFDRPVVALRPLPPASARDATRDEPPAHDD